ncbi:MAG: adenylate/guanylate cyclase domain-containing protein [Bacteroidia bacterium]|nr:adenylate/guanylate cyclase domain-containing protein [Bacteroidia bacterium]
MWLLILVQGTVVGFGMGLIFGLTDVIFDMPIFEDLSFKIMIFLRVVAHIATTLLLMALSHYLIEQMPEDQAETYIAEFLATGTFSKTSFVIVIYTGVVSVLLGLFRQINSMFGPGMLVKLLAGRYYKPKEEERIFMFLDLKSSTTYAERLGHKLYSELIQDCFHDLTDAIKKHKASVYQYVGDEAVLTWQLADGLKDGHCIRAFFTFEQSIQERAKYYFNKYDLVPVFKAGVNCGLVMTAEVGVVKKEIAYHSDVLNTAARIQGRCNELGQKLLVSEYIIKHLPSLDDFVIEEQGIVPLKGKKKDVILYSIQPREEIAHPFAFSE